MSDSPYISRLFGRAVVLGTGEMVSGGISPGISPQRVLIGIREIRVTQRTRTNTVGATFQCSIKWSTMVLA